MDALDGGAWEYGDDSVPQSGVTYFAGTFVRHPLALAACKASLEYMKKKGPSLQEEINGRTAKLAGALNAICDQEGLPFFAAHFGSLWKIKSKKEIPYIELLFVGMREKGIHILDGFPCFLTELHRGEEVDSMIRAFRESALEMKDAGFFLSDLQTWEVHPLVGNELQQQPPEEGARWGKDRQGNPAWFIADPSRPGKYLQLT
jgi:glutamate-1-semialdehyde aminotransferase